MKDDKQHEYVGNLHIHSIFSDGAGTVPEIAKSAASLGLDFVVINDHDHMTDSLHTDEEGFYSGLLVLIGLEIGYNSHHYLAFNIKDKVNSKNLSPQEVIDLVDKQGGFGFLAHPFEKGMPFHDKSISYTWNELSVTGFAGIEIWNFASRWKERIKSPVHGLLHLLFKSKLLKGPSRETLYFWDRLCQERRLTAIGGSDAHGAVFRWGPVRLSPLPYKYALNSVNVHILLDTAISDDVTLAKAQVYDAMRHGRLFIAHDRLVRANGFRFYFTSDSGSLVHMGEEFMFEPGDIHVDAPQRSEIRLIKNGELQLRHYGQNACFRAVDKGVYRVELFLRRFPFGLRPWIFSNPVYLR
ncbi:PHP domain protein [uncultured Desulfobacterium sp.]|uniref:PHP domain protein n=1 Tax=uncultured Desulfobacterium sp. TaxID=201089 RepID=A0A445N362_9BACT|nr:PHP domain protein [uncultured Desulfobacterium sp.]